MPTPLVPPAEPSLAEALADLRREVDRRLEALVPVPRDDNDRIALAMRAAVLSTGKRVRPLMLMLAMRELGGDARGALELGCAVELVHAASLVLDDMPCMDDAWLRRGQPTVHVRFGEDVAVLTAVALLNLAFKVVVRAPGVAPLVRVRLVEVLSDAVGTEGLVRGQFEDLHEGARARQAAEVSGTNHLKTGALFAAALEMAALASRASVGVAVGLREAAYELGQAFQLYDDLCDGDPDAELGKDAGKDKGKSTLVALLGPEGAKHRLRHHLQRVEGALGGVFGGGSALLRLVQSLFPRLH